MHGPGFGADKAAFAVDLRQLVKLGQVDFLNHSTLLTQQGDGAVKSSTHGFINAVKDKGLGHGQTQGVQGRRCHGHVRLVGQDGVHNGATLYRGSQRAIGVQAARQRHGAFAGNALGGGFETGQAVKGRRDTDGAARVGTNGENRHALGNRDTGAGGRTTRDAGIVTVPDGTRRTVVGVDAQTGEGKLGHIGGADQNGTGAQQALHNGGVLFGRFGVFQYSRPTQSDVACDVMQVLDRHGQTFNQRAAQTGSAQNVGGFGGGQSLFSKHFDERGSAVTAFVLDTVQGLLGQFDRGGFATIKSTLQFGNSR